jgi:hypothetical protein
MSRTSNIIYYILIIYKYFNNLNKNKIMVLINLKPSEKNQFIYETKSGIEVAELLKELILGKFAI